jgi:hypothetical protein
MQLGHETGELSGDAAPLRRRYLDGRPAIEPASNRPRPGIIRARGSTSHWYRYSHGYLLGENREPALLVDEQIDRYLPAWEPYTKVVTQAIEHVVPAAGNKLKRPRQVRMLRLDQACNELVVHVDVGHGCLHRSIIRQALNEIKVVSRRTHSMGIRPDQVRRHAAPGQL